jgi:uncharacterized protein YdcH (DUF465 family)
MSTLTAPLSNIYRPAQEMPKQEVGNINPFGISSDPVLKKQYEESIEAQRKVADALEQRYANPNWGRISAALLKPQLGGFAASFGSAQEELGNYQEAARAAQPTVAQMRADVAKGLFTLAQQNKAAQIAEGAANRGYINQSEAGLTEGFTKGSAGVGKAMTEQEVALVNMIAQKLNTSGSLANTEFVIGAPTFNRLLPQVLERFPDLRNKPEIQQYLNKNQPAGSSSTKTSSAPSAGNQAALAENERKTRALIERTKNEITPADKAELDKLNKERTALGGQPIIAPRLNLNAQTKPAEKVGYYSETHTRPNVERLSQIEREQRLGEYNKTVENTRNTYDSLMNNYMEVASEPNWSTLQSSVEGSLNILKKNPDIAKNVFNMIRGDGELKNQVMALLQSGVGINVGNFNGALNIPVESMMRAGISPRDQAVADVLARNMLTIGLARLQAQGVRPEKGSEAYANALTTKANLGETPISAFKALKGEEITFNTIKGIHDIVNKEMKEKRYNPDSATPKADIFKNSSAIKEKEKEALERRTALNQQFEDYISKNKNRKKP